MNKFPEKQQIKKDEDYLQKLCRFCRQEYDIKVPPPNYNNLEEVEECKKVECVTKLSLHQFTNDKSPKHMCSGCAAKVEEFNGSSDLIYETDARMRNRVELDPNNSSLESKRKEEGKVLFSIPFKPSIHSPDENSVKSNVEKMNEGVPIFSTPMMSLNDDSSTNSDSELEEAASSLMTLALKPFQLDH